MPIWKVSEPYINLWLYDEPVAYQAGFGPSSPLALPTNNEGEGGSHPWSRPGFTASAAPTGCARLSYVEDDGVGAQAILNLRRGGVAVYAPPNGSSIEYDTHTTLLRQTNGAGVLTGFIRTYPSGAHDY